MATQELTTMKLTFQTNVKEKDISTMENLYIVLDDLTSLKFDGAFADNLNKLGTSLKSFSGINIKAGLGKGISNLVSSLNEIKNVNDISPYADNLNKSFSALAKAAKHFDDINVKLSGASGKGIGEIAKVLGEIEKVNDITPYAKQIENGFKILSNATKHFEGNSASIRANIGTPIKSLIESINSISGVTDITPYGENIKRGFDILSKATKSFEGNGASISVNLGRSITGLVDAINKIDDIKDISGKAQVIQNNFGTIANATRSFSGMNNADYSGISRLVTAMTNIGKVKKINDNVIDNAKKLAQAINILDKETTGGTAKLRQINIAAKNLGVTMKNTTKETKGFWKSLSVLDYAAITYGITKITGALSKLMHQAYGTVKAYGEVQNTMSFFAQSLGSEAGKTASLIQQYADFGAIDFTEFADQTAKLNQMYKGYGISSENAAKMALNFTQIAYDASYALGKNGEDLEKWFNVMTSISAGQTRAGYQLGVSTGVKSLQEEFDGLTNSADMATRVMAAYEVVLANTVPIQGQLAREFGNSYVQAQVFKNRLNQLKQSIGANLIPAFQTLIQASLVALKVVERVIDAVSRLFGGAGFQLINYKDMINDIAGETDLAAGGANDIAKGMDKANKAAKELKKTISGIDQVFTINDIAPSDKDKGSNDLGLIGGNVSGYDWLETLATAENLKMLDEIDRLADEVVMTIKNGIPWVVAFGTALLAWKISKSFLSNLKWISGLKDIGGGLGLDKLTFGIGLTLFIADLNKFRKAVDDILANGVNFTNVGNLISSFVGMIADALIVTGNIKIGGALKVIQGVGDIVIAIKSMIDNDINWDDALKVVDGISNVVIGIGLFTGNWALVSGGLILQGAVLIIEQIDEVWTAIRTGDWSGVDKADLLIGALLVAGGVVVAIKKFKEVVDKGNASGGLTQAASATKTMSDATGGVSTNLTSLAKNLGLGIVIMAEIAVIAVIFIGAIWAIGEMMQNVIKAWKPVIDDGGTATIAILAGTAILVGVGVAAFALGSAAVTSGGTIPLALAAGVGMLVLLGINAAIFLKEIEIVGKMLINIDNAWKPLNNRGGSIASSIAIGTGILIGVGAAAGALGVASVASFGLLPLAIAAGTAMLVQLGDSSKLFITELATTGDALANQLAPSMADLNLVLPDLTGHTRKFTAFMIEFAGHIVAYTGTSAVGGLAGAIDTIVGWFTKDPIKKMADDAKKNHKQFTSLRDALVITNPLAQKSNELMVIYLGLLDQLHINANKASSLGEMPHIGVQFKDFSKSLKDGFKDLESIKTTNVANIMSALKSIDLSRFKGIGTSIVKSMEMGINDYQFNFNTMISKVKTTMTFKVANEGSNIAKDFILGINNAPVSLESFVKKIKTNLTFSTNSFGTSIASGVVSGINASQSNITIFTNRIKSSLTFGTTTYGSSIGSGVVSGINNSSVNISSFTSKIQRSLSLNTSTYGRSMASGVVGGINSSSTSTTTFTNNIKTSLNFSSNYIGGNISAGVQNGINQSVVNLNTFVTNVKRALQNAFKIFSPSRWARDFIGNNIGVGVVDGVNETDIDFSPFKNDVSSSLYDLVDDIVVTPTIDMPVFDTRSIRGQYDNISTDFESRVKGQLELKNDSTERAIDNLNSDTVDLMERLIMAVEQGQTITIGDEVIGESANNYNRNMIIKKNTIGR